MKKIIALLALLTLAAPVSHAQGANAAGRWRAEFDTQIGVQKYLYTLKRDGAALLGQASAEMGGEKRDVVLQDVKLVADTLTFTELSEYQGNPLVITYRGIVRGDEIRFTRKVADFATEELVARREKPAGG